MKIGKPLMSSFPSFAIRLILVFHLLYLPIFGFSQNQVFRFLTADEGLPDNEVFDVHQSRDGAIWIATDLGICRFNGKRFTYIRNPTQRSKALTGLQEDKWGRLWAFNFFGEIFYIEQDSLKLFESFDPKNSNSLHTMAWNKDRDIFIVSASGGTYLYQLKKTTEGKYTDTLLKSWNFSSINPIFDSKDRIWMVGYSQKEFDEIWNYEKGNLLNFRVLGQTKKQSSRLNLLFESRDSMYMLDRINRNLYIKRNDGFHFQTVFNEIAYINEIVKETDGNFSLLTRQGIYSLDTNWQITPIYPTFAGNNISKKIIDHEGNKWLATLDAGIGIVPDSRLKIWRDFTKDYGTNNITALTKGPAQKLILGFTNGLIILFDPENGKSKLLYKPEVPGEVSFLNYDQADSLLTWYNNKSYTAKLTNTLSMRDPISLSSVKSIASCPWDKTFAVATGTGVEKIDIRLLLNSHKKPIPRVFRKNISNVRSRSIAADPVKKRIYIGSRDGLETIDSLGNKKQITLNNQAIYATQIEKIKDGFLIATINQGLITLKDGMTEKVYTTGNKIISNTILEMALDYPSCWIKTDIGLQLFNLQTFESKLLNKDNGLPTSQINGMLNIDGTLFLATPNGLVFTSYLLPEPEASATFDPIIRSIFVNKQKVDVSALSKLDHDLNDLEFEVELPSFHSRVGVNFQYKLQHNGKGIWRTNEDGILVFDQLLPGNYQLTIQAVDMNSTKVGKVKNLYFLIKKPFWETPSWYILIILVLGGFIWFWIRFYMRRINKLYLEKQEKLKLYEDLKKSMLVSIKAQMNPHFIFNALNTIQSFIYSNNKQEANEYLVKFSRLIRMVLEMSNHETILLAEEIVALELYLDLEKSRFEDSLNYSITLGENIRPGQIRIPSMIIQPYVENAIKHGLLHRIGERWISIQFNINKDKSVLIVEIEDNGVGRKQSKLINARKGENHVSFSSAANEKRLELLNADSQKQIVLEYFDKTDEFNSDIGTIVRLQIPF